MVSLAHLEELLKDWAAHVPLEFYSFFGSFIEEVIAPIPSPLVMASAGSVAFAQSRSYIYLAFIAMIGAVGKMFGAWVIYYFADKLEDVLVGKFGKFLGLSHKELESLGKRFSGGSKDFWLLFFLRMAPVVPSSPVSAVCGLIKLNLKVYLCATALGTFFRNMFYLYIGYAGVAAYEHILKGFESTESILQIIMLVGVAGFLIWAYSKRSKR